MFKLACFKVDINYAGYKGPEVSELTYEVTFHNRYRHWSPTGILKTHTGFWVSPCELLESSGTGWHCPFPG